jgi:hypothetical protein
MIVTDYRTRNKNRHEPGSAECPGTEPDTTNPHTDTGIGVGVVGPVAGMIRTITWQPDVLALARREIGAATVEYLSLGHTIVAGGLQIWLDEDGLRTGKEPNPRASALIIAALYHRQRPLRVLRQLFVGDALLCAAPTRHSVGSGLSGTEAAIVTRATTRLSHAARPQPIRRALGLRATPTTGRAAHANNSGTHAARPGPVDH